MLGGLGLPLALTALPLTAAAILLVIAAAPTAATVACAEIVRKVCTRWKAQHIKDSLPGYDSVLHSGNAEASALR